MDIHKILETTPAILARKSELAENLRHEWQNGKELYTHKEAKFALHLKATQPDLKVSEIKYYLNDDPLLYNARLNLILMETLYRRAECEIKALEEELRSAKMLARIRISEWESQLEGGKR